MVQKCRNRIKAVVKFLAQDLVRFFYFHHPSFAQSTAK
jgi:hypothetical protein